MIEIHINDTSSHTRDFTCYCEPHIRVSDDYILFIHSNQKPVLFREWEQSVIHFFKQSDSSTS